MSLMPDPTFYPSPRVAMQAPPERLAYVALLNDGKNGKHDGIGVIDLHPDSSEYGRVVGQVDEWPCQLLRSRREVFDAQQRRSYRGSLRASTE